MLTASFIFPTLSLLSVIVFFFSNTYAIPYLNMKDDNFQFPFQKREAAASDIKAILESSATVEKAHLTILRSEW